MYHILHKTIKKICDLCVFPIIRLQKAAVSSGSSFTSIWIRFLSTTPAVIPYIAEPPAFWPTPFSVSPRTCECVYVTLIIKGCFISKTGKNWKSPTHCRNSQIFLKRSRPKTFLWHLNGIRNPCIGSLTKTLLSHKNL